MQKKVLGGEDGPPGREYTGTMRRHRRPEKTSFADSTRTVRNGDWRVNYNRALKRCGEGRERRRGIHGCGVVETEERDPKRKPASGLDLRPLANEVQKWQT